MGGPPSGAVFLGARRVPAGALVAGGGSPAAAVRLFPLWGRAARVHRRKLRLDGGGAGAGDAGTKVADAGGAGAADRAAAGHYAAAEVWGGDEGGEAAEDL